MADDPSDDLTIRPQDGLPDGLVIPADELGERFSRSSGPGGQGVNTTDSRVELTWNIAESTALTDHERARLLDALAARLVGGTVTIRSSESRAQLDNRVSARARLSALIAEAFVPRAERRRTRPTRASQQRRLDAKKQHSRIKAARRKVEPGD